MAKAVVKIKVLFFARLREELGAQSLQLDIGEAQTAEDVRATLIRERGPNWETVLGAENILVAVNQELVEWNQVLGSGDEVAFFPPVTGG